MKTRALIAALAATLLLLPLISAWCPRCFAGSCSMERMAEAATPDGDDVSCHAMDTGSGLAIAAADTDCCAVAVEPAPQALGAVIVAVDVRFDLESPLAAAVAFAPRLAIEGRGDTPPPPPELPTPLYTLHSSLLL